MNKKQTGPTKKVDKVANQILNIVPYSRKFMTILKAEAGGINNKLIPLLQRKRLNGKHNSPSTGFQDIWIALIYLRNSAMNLTRKNLLAQVFSGHSDMRDLYQAMMVLNSLCKQLYKNESGIFSELLMKRIAGFSIPLMFKQCHSYFYNASEELKIHKDQRKAQIILMRRYDVKDIESVSLDLLYLKTQGKIMVHCFQYMESDYIPEQFYAQEFRPTLHSRLSLYKKQIQYYEEALKQGRYSREESEKQEANIGLFAIGYPNPPAQIFESLKKEEEKNKAIIDIGISELWSQYLRNIIDKKRTRVKENALDKQTILYDLNCYKWNLVLWILEPRNFTFKQVNTNLQTIIQNKKVKYGEVSVPKLPFSFGEHSNFTPLKFNFFNEKDDSVHGMHLCLDLFKEAIVEESNIKEETKLAVINYSCNGWSLRLQLLSGRKWLITNELVFEIDPPESNEDQDEYWEEDYTQHFVYEILLTFHPEEYKGNSRKGGTQKGRSISSGKIYQWREVKKLYIVIREFASKQVVDILRPGDSFDAVRVTVYDRKAKRDVTEAAIMSREGEEVKEQSGEWEVCLVNEYPEENVFVWARDVVSSLRTSQFSHIPIEYFGTYFECDPIYSEKELTNAPS